MLRRGLRHFARQHELPYRELRAHVAWWFVAPDGVDWYIVRVDRHGVLVPYHAASTLQREVVGALRAFSRSAV